jgi:hypothetical protein
MTRERVIGEVCVCVREREWRTVSKRECKNLCVWVWQREREKEWRTVSKRECRFFFVCVRERERE